MSLPLPWVDKIFDKLTMVYGHTFLNRWKDLDLNAIKSDWMHELSGFERAPHAIAYALSNLPESPQNVMQFKALCRLAPAAAQQALPEPKADPARVAAELAKLAPLREAPVQPKDYKAWARKILAEHSAGIRRTPAVVQMAKNALAAV